MLKQIRYVSGFSFNNKTETYDLEIPVWKVLDNLTTLENRPNKTLFCKMLNYDNHFIGYKFNNSLNETTINECFFINNSNIDDRGMINSGATQISSKIFEQRCLNEISWFFNGQETPQVGYEVDGKADLMQDSYLKTKYSYLSPYGFQIDEKFRATTIHHSSVFDGIINSGRIPPRRLPVFPTIRFDSKLNIKPPVDVNDDLRVSPKPIVDSRPPVITTQNVSDIAKQRINRINASSLAIYTRNIDRLR
jgi:hypothetical protein